MSDSSWWGKALHNALYTKGVPYNRANELTAHIMSKPKIMSRLNRLRDGNYPSPISDVICEHLQGEFAHDSYMSRCFPKTLDRLWKEMQRLKYAPTNPVSTTSAYYPGKYAEPPKENAIMTASTQDSSLITRITDKVHTVGVQFLEDSATGSLYGYKSAVKLKKGAHVMVPTVNGTHIAIVKETNFPLPDLQGNKQYKWVKGVITLINKDVEKKEAKIIKLFKSLQWDHSNKLFLKASGVSKKDFDKLVRKI